MIRQHEIQCHRPTVIVIGSPGPRQWLGEASVFILTQDVFPKTQAGQSAQSPEARPALLLHLLLPYYSLLPHFTKGKRPPPDLSRVIVGASVLQCFGLEVTVKFVLKMIENPRVLPLDMC